jgi:hypothetical protein
MMAASLDKDLLPYLFVTGALRPLPVRRRSWVMRILARVLGRGRRR